MADHRGHTTSDAEDMADRPDRAGVTTRPADDRAPPQVTETRTARRPAAHVSSRGDVDHTTDVKISEASNLTRDRVRWGPMPTQVYLGVALGSIGLSALLRLFGKKDAAVFVGEWPPTFILFALAYKILQPSNENMPTTVTRRSSRPPTWSAPAANASPAFVHSRDGILAQDAVSRHSITDLGFSHAEVGR